MKITIDRKLLIRALDRTKAATDSKATTMPILSSVKLVADPDRLLGCLTVSGTDLYVSSTTDVHCSVDEDGGCCINAKDLYSRLKLMPEDEVSISVADHKATIKAKGSKRKFVLNSLPIDEYPSIPKMSEGCQEITVMDRDLLEKIESTIFSVSPDETRSQLNSLLFQEQNGKLTLASTDGHRLTVLRDTSITSPRDILVPLNAAKEIANLCRESVSCKAKEDDFHKVHLYPDGSVMFVVTNGFTFSCKLSDGYFPPYGQIIPKTWNNEVKVTRESLVNALKAVSVSAGATNGVKLEFTDGNKLTITAASQDGIADDEIECNYSGDNKFEIGVNCTYLIQALTYVCSEYAVLKISNDLDPVLIEQNVDSETEQKEEYLAIVMPMRL